MATGYTVCLNKQYEFDNYCSKALQMVICQRKLTFQTNKYALREKIQIVSVKTGKNNNCSRSHWLLLIPKKKV